MAIRSDEITSIIKSAIDSFDAGVETRSVGTVVEVGDGIAQVYGLSDALASELLEFPGGVMGMALNLEEETVGAVILGSDVGIKEGDTPVQTGIKAIVALIQIGRRQRELITGDRETGKTAIAIDTIINQKGQG